MKLAIAGDIHFCKTSSIIAGTGTKFSTRLESCLNSVNWFENLATTQQCDAIIYLGDFFNTAEVDDETITAVSTIQWSDLPHYFLVGNHDSSVDGLYFNAIKMLEAANRFIVDTFPFSLVSDTTQIHFLPYITELNRQPIETYITKNASCTKHVILSHNDIAGIQLGPVQSTLGFDLSAISGSCDLFINGHMHNGSWLIPGKVRNLGIFSGQNFGENAFDYSHVATVLDTATCTCEDFLNPFAFNFYKIEIGTEVDLDQLDNLQANAVLSIKCEDSLQDKLHEKLASLPRQPIETRIFISSNFDMNSDSTIDLDLSVDHLAKFIQCCKENIDNTVILDAELAEICK